MRERYQFKRGDRVSILTNWGRQSGHTGTVTKVTYYKRGLYKGEMDRVYVKVDSPMKKRYRNYAPSSLRMIHPLEQLAECAE